MSSDGGRILGLDEAGRQRRPAASGRITFDDLAAPVPTGRVDGGRLIPIESVQAGDEQVFAARLPHGSGELVIDLDRLAEFPSVRSVVASTTVRAGRSLPQIEELLLFSRTPVPDAKTLQSLSGLARFWAGRAPLNRRLAVEALPARTLRELGVSRAALPGGLAELSELMELRHLVLHHCIPKDGLQPLAGLTRLTRLRADAPGGWSALAACTALEEVYAIRPRLSNLRAFRAWTRLKSLVLTGAGVRGLDGMEAFAGLERLKLIALKVDDLSPLANLSRLTELELSGLERLKDLGPLAGLTSLRQLVIARVGGELRDIVHVDSLRPLAGARALEEVSLVGAVVDDSDLAPLVDLPALRRVRVFGDLGAAVADLRRARPDIVVIWGGGSKPSPGLPAGPVFLHPPDEKIPVWWLREDLTRLLQVPTNADAEDRLRAALATEDAPLLARLRFDTEADAVVVESEREEDLRAVARVIEQLARSL